MEPWLAFGLLGAVLLLLVRLLETRPEPAPEERMLMQIRLKRFAVWTLRACIAVQIIGVGALPVLKRLDPRGFADVGALEIVALGSCMVAAAWLIGSLLAASTFVATDKGVYWMGTHMAWAQLEIAWSFQAVDIREGARAGLRRRKRVRLPAFTYPVTRETVSALKDLAQDRA